MALCLVTLFDLSFTDIFVQRSNSIMYKKVNTSQRFDFAAEKK